MSTIKVRYVGAKPQETDHLYGSNITWTGFGDVQEVPARCWGGMSKHPDVWELAPSSAAVGKGLSQVAAPPAAALAPEPQVAEGPESISLLGSDTLPPILDIGGNAVQLGQLVAITQAKSGLPVADWNKLAPAARDLLLNSALGDMRAAFADEGKETSDVDKANAPAPASSAPAPDAIDYDAMELPDLKALAKERGVLPPGNVGKAKVIAALRGEA